VIQLDSLDPINLKNFKTQNGGGHHFEKINISQQQFDGSPRNLAW